MLAVLVHVAFFALLIFGVNWRAEEAPGMVVDIWSDLPENAPAPRPAPPPPQVETPKPEPVPVKKIEPKPTPPAPITKAEVPKADIALKEKKQKPEKPKPEPIKPQKQDLLKQEQLQQEQARQLEITRQQQAQAELARLAAARQSAAQQSVINDYSERIRAKMRSKLNKDICGTDNPELIFDMRLLPTGEIYGNPKMQKGSGIPACDKAVFDAIKLSEPLPIPTQPDIFNEFRELRLTFKPHS